MRTTRRRRSGATPGGLGGPREGYRRGGVDVVGAGGVQIPHRVVGEPGEVDHRVEALEIARPDRADVLADAPRAGAEGGGAHVAALEEVGVEPGDRVSPRPEEGHQHRPDIAVVTRYKYAQSVSLPPLNAAILAARPGRAQRPRGKRFTRPDFPAAGAIWGPCRAPGALRSRSALLSRTLSLILG